MAFWNFAIHSSSSYTTNLFTIERLVQTIALRTAKLKACGSVPTEGTFLLYRTPSAGIPGKSAISRQRMEIHYFTGAYCLKYRACELQFASRRNPSDSFPVN